MAEGIHGLPPTIQERYTPEVGIAHAWRTVATIPAADGSPSDHERCLLESRVPAFGAADQRVRAVFDSDDVGARVEDVVEPITSFAPPWHATLGVTPDTARALEGAVVAEERLQVTRLAPSASKIEAG